MSFSVTILGNNSAKPTANRHPSAQIVQIENHVLLVDCGEGTQMQMLRHSIKWGKIDHIFISHLHGDHFLGLVPLLDTYNLSGRTRPLHIYCPAGIQTLVECHKAVTGGWGYGYELVFHHLQTQKSELILDTPLFSVTTILLNHGVPCTGFLFAEKTKDRNMIKAQIKTYTIPFQAIPAIKKGGDFTTKTGEIIPNEILTTSPPKPKVYAYCSDTAYHEPIISVIKEADLLYHETTYLQDMQEEAAKRGHSTALQAAQIAQQAGVRQLIIGHFSARYMTLDLFITEAQTVFPNTALAVEGQTFEL